MLNTIIQIFFGICYGLYLAILAPTSERQKAHALLAKQVVVPMLQPEPTQSQVEAPIAEPITLTAVESHMLEDPWLTKLALNTTDNQVTTEVISVVPKTPKLLLLPPAQLNSQQSFNSSRKKTKATKTKRTKKVDRASGKISAALVKKNVEQLRSLCNEQNIKWRNAHGSKHLTKSEMLERLTA